MHNRKQLSSQVLFSNHVPHIDISLSNLCIVILLQLLVPDLSQAVDSLVQPKLHMSTVSDAATSNPTCDT